MLESKTTIVIINGSRTFDDYALLEEKCYEILSPYIERGDKIIIREGDARGCDKLAEKFAKENNWELQIYKADWQNLGKKAGILRNIKMINGRFGDAPANIMIAFNKGTPGTTHALNYMRQNTVFTAVYEIKC